MFRRILMFICHVPFAKYQIHYTIYHTQYWDPFLCVVGWGPILGRGSMQLTTRGLRPLSCAIADSQLTQAPT